MGTLVVMVCVLVLMVVGQGFSGWIPFERRSISRCSLFDSPQSGKLCEWGRGAALDHSSLLPQVGTIKL